MATRFLNFVLEAEILGIFMLISDPNLPKLATPPPKKLNNIHSRYSIHLTPTPDLIPLPLSSSSSSFRFLFLLSAPVIRRRPNLTSTKCWAFWKMIPKERFMWLPYWRTKRSICRSNICKSRLIFLQDKWK